MPEFYNATRPIARKAHHCHECNRTIQPGERYERVSAKWDGSVDTVKACVYCIAMRDLVEQRAKCFCWLHHHLRDDIRDWLDEEAYRVPGVAFAIGRLEVERRADR